MDSENKESKKEIKVVTGNGEDLDISTVYEHVKSKDSQSSENNNNNKKGDIVIPKGSSKED